MVKAAAEGPGGQKEPVFIVSSRKLKSQLEICKVFGGREAVNGNPLPLRPFPAGRLGAVSVSQEPAGNNTVLMTGIDAPVNGPNRRIIIILSQLPQPVRFWGRPPATRTRGGPSMPVLRERVAVSWGSFNFI